MGIRMISSVIGNETIALTGAWLSKTQMNHRLVIPSAAEESGCARELHMVYGQMLRLRCAPLSMTKRQKASLGVTRADR
jgi:hypothetical protein